MNPLEFAGEVILVSASGVLSPGPYDDNKPVLGIINVHPESVQPHEFFIMMKYDRH
jgi:hypothetical protein